MNELQYNTTRDTENLTDKYVDASIFLYLVGLNCFKSGTPFDAFMCRSLFLVMMVFVIFSGNKDSNTQKYYSLKWYVCFFSLYFISFIWGNIEDGMYYINNIIEIIGNCYVFGKRINSKERLLKYLKYLLVSIVGMVFLIIIRKGGLDYSDLRSSSSIGLNINDVGFRCGVGMLIALLFASRNKYYYFICILTSVYSLLSGSKKALFFVCTSLVAYMFLRFKGSKRYLFLTLSIIIVAIIIYLVFSIPILYDLLGWRLYKFYLTAFDDSRYFSESGNMIVDTSYEYRSFFKVKAMEIFSENPLLGCGANGFSSSVAKYVGISTYSHCNYTELLSTLGVSGLVLYYFPFIKPLYYVLREIPQRDNIIILSAIFIFSKIFLDYETVSYISVFNNLIIIMICEYIVNTYSMDRAGATNKTQLTCQPELN